MIVSGAEGSTKARFGVPTGPIYQTPAGGGLLFRSPIGKPGGNGREPRAFRSPGVPIPTSAPRFWERKGAEGGTEVISGAEGSTR